MEHLTEQFGCSGQVFDLAILASAGCSAKAHFDEGTAAVYRPRRPAALEEHLEVADMGDYTTRVRHSVTHLERFKAYWVSVSAIGAAGEGLMSDPAIARAA